MSELFQLEGIALYGLRVGRSMSIWEAERRPELLRVEMVRDFR